MRAEAPAPPTGTRASRPDAPSPIPAAARVYLAPGRMHASARDELVTTILGSCVAVCVWDAAAGVGGINHFLLPTGSPASERFGDSAVPLLVARLVALGARPGRMEAKVFGGACVLDAFRADAPSLGARNLEVARERLAANGIPVVGGDVGGDLGRRLVFGVRTGAAWVRLIEMRA